MVESTLWGRRLLALVVVFFVAMVGQTSAMSQDGEGAGKAESEAKVKKDEADAEARVKKDKAETSKESSTAFKASNEAPKENLPAWPFLFGAYAFIWLLLFGYIVFLWRKHVAIEAQLAKVKKRMDDFDGALDALEKK